MYGYVGYLVCRSNREVHVFARDEVHQSVWCLLDVPHLSPLQTLSGVASPVCDTGKRPEVIMWICTT